ncbi:MAG TPA: PSD1 and planctomycete cytochrome C domain-containing protein [Roseibacillus sp.]|nr:PSD1 and planctomycete cytochrome C domain-containing protein [Roseibacillus sp.]
MRSLTLITTISLAALGFQTAMAAEEVAADMLFARKVLPLFKQRCIACHGEDPKKKLKGEFDMRTRADLLKGGESEEPSLVPGKPLQSPLYLASTRAHEDDWEPMPPKENDKLSAKEIAYIRDWIAGGAPWPDAQRITVLLEQEDPWATEDGVLVKTSGGLSREWTNRKYASEDLWAYQPIRHPEPPMESTNPIDGFIEAQLPGGLQPAPAADRLTLIRRATFDLTGLPPTPEEIDGFLADGTPGAYGRLLARLLASTHYGEQWGRHWLDVVRYADSGGFANDFERPNAWRYRDYVVRSFNQDKPYHQFIREQIAGDEIDPGSTENKIAVGFLRMGPWEQTGMSVAAVTRQQFLDDITDSVGQVFLGQVLMCVQCHDHKFDPVPVRDYYSLQATFANTQIAEVDAPFLPGENTSGFAQHRKYHHLRDEENKRMLKALPKERVSPDDFGRERLGRKWSKLLSWGRDRYRPIAYTVYNGKPRLQKNVSARQHTPKENPGAQMVPEKTAILPSGDLFSPGDIVQPGVLTVTGLGAKFPATVEGRRTALANWIIHKDNPLTARVMVNRVWQYHFGRGLAANPNNFGSTGSKPTHPELLDWLASEFMARGWSVKKLHRLIMSSEAYRRASTHPDAKALARLDPDHASHAVFRPRRLSAEELRDSMLAVTGELNRQPGGIPARPDINLEAALQPRMIMGTFAPSYLPDPKPAQRNRRSIYALKLRGHRDPFMTTFNQPAPDKSCELRDSSNVTPQVFTLFNSEESADRALAFAARILKEGKPDQAVVRHAFRLAFGRVPEAKETQAALSHWHQATAEQASRRPEPRVYPREVTRQANEENTGQPFTFTEKLFEYQDYEPDLQPHQVDARTRGLADLCLVLLNSSEFVYVY